MVMTSLLPEEPEKAPSAKKRYQLLFAALMLLAAALSFYWWQQKESAVPVPEPLALPSPPPAESIQAKQQSLHQTLLALSKTLRQHGEIRLRTLSVTPKGIRLEAASYDPRAAFVFSTLKADILSLHQGEFVVNIPAPDQQTAEQNPPYSGTTNHPEILKQKFSTKPPGHWNPVETNAMQLADLLRMLAAKMQQDVIVSPEIKGTVTLSLGNTAPDVLFDNLIREHHLTVTEKNNIKTISSPKSGIRIFQVHYADASATAGWLADKKNHLLSDEGSVHVDMRTNQLVVRDLPAQLQEIAALLARLDVPVKQVLIEARLASIDRQFERELGVDFSEAAKKEDRDHTGHPGSFSLALIHLADNSMLDIRLSALETKGHAELISSPKLFTANREPARIESGEEIPYQEISRSGATAVTFRKAVLSLEVTPQILPGDQVQLQLVIHQDRPAGRMVLGVPTISTRQLKSSILLKNGQTVVLGGIFENSQNETRTGLPFLSGLPVIGPLFRQQVRESGQRELLVFVTPRVIGS